MLGASSIDVPGGKTYFEMWCKMSGVNVHVLAWAEESGQESSENAQCDLGVFLQLVCFQHLIDGVAVINILSPPYSVSCVVSKKPSHHNVRTLFY